MDSKAWAARLRCALCRGGLLKNYNVYDLPEGGAPVAYSTATGYFYCKGPTREADVLEIAGNVQNGGNYTYRMIIFKNKDGEAGCKVEDLIDIPGFYKITRLNEVYGVIYEADLEAYPYANSI